VIGQVFGFCRPNHREELLENSTVVLVTEAILRVILGWRFLISGLSNVWRWPNPVRTASIVFPKGAAVFGLIATVLMVAGGLGLVAGFQTPLAALMLIIFLLPTFNVHSYWLKVLPTMAPVLESSLSDEKALRYFQTFNRQAYHAHEVGIRDNLVLLAAALYFAARGAGAYALDTWLAITVVRLF